jgi:hypothetical protein
MSGILRLPQAVVSGCGWFSFANSNTVVGQIVPQCHDDVYLIIIIKRPPQLLHLRVQ